MNEISNVVEFKPVIPKSYKATYEGCEYRLTFNPNARTPDERWQWKVTIIHRHEHYGNAKDESAATKAAKRFIEISLGKRKVN